MTLSALEKSKQWQWAVELLSNMSILVLKGTFSGFVQGDLM
jgi:hypothetical protein